MELKWLRTFLLTAKLQNYRKVAESLHMTQPAISSHIKLLEQSLGASLFRKEGRRITLTSFGRSFIPEAQSLIAHYEDMMHRTSRMQQGYNSSLSIAITPLLVDSVFPAILRKFAEDHPEVELEITVAESFDLQELVEDAKVDVALSCLKSTSVHMSCVNLVDEPISLVIAHDGWDTETAPVLDPVELMATSIIFTDHHPSYWPSLKQQIRDNVSSYRFVKVSQSHAAKRFILEGMGVSFLPLFTARREIQEGRLLPVETPFLELPTSSIFALFNSDDQKISGFVDYLRRFKVT
ncbi:LysR family transcriptional regulator [Halobacillus salinus]|uniref:LysR family transcriptional regulator n=1 Tax=Halobacillus salinus TaxID=192814 RepID=UPI0009A75091|nr:LysR family transcriptional regulator [Halobacillus salinus]